MTFYLQKPHRVNSPGFASYLNSFFLIKIAIAPKLAMNREILLQSSAPQKALTALTHEGSELEVLHQTMNNLSG